MEIVKLTHTQLHIKIFTKEEKYSNINNKSLLQNNENLTNVNNKC